MVARAVTRPVLPLLQVSNLEVSFSLRGSFLAGLLGQAGASVNAVDGVSFDLKEREVLGLVGESGSGKTTLGRAVLGLVEPTAGTVTFEGRRLDQMSSKELRAMRRRAQIVFQDPHASLNPAMDIGTAVAHPLTIHGVTRDRAEVKKRVTAALARVGLAPPELFMSKYPRELSGGQKQRAVLARSLILGPKLIVADEPVSMLDMSVRATILDLMCGLKEELGLTFVYITHDLATAKFFCDRIAIMYLGRIVEIGSCEAIFAEPRHPYTRSLLKAIPELDASERIPRDILRGEVPDAVRPPAGCGFHPRCANAFNRCGWEPRDLKDILEARWAVLPEAEYKRERSLFGDLAGLEKASTSRVAQLTPPRRRGDELLSFLLALRAEGSEDPFWRGVREVRRTGEHVEVEFAAGVEPALQPVGRVAVACHLYDEADRMQRFRQQGGVR